MKRFKIVVMAIILGSLILLPNMWRENTYSTIKPVRIILPQPKKDSRVSVEEALSNRRSIRSYKKNPITLKELSPLISSRSAMFSRILATSLFLTEKGPSYCHPTSLLCSPLDSSAGLVFHHRNYWMSEISHYSP